MELSHKSSRLTKYVYKRLASNDRCVILNVLKNLSCYPVSTIMPKCFTKNDISNLTQKKNI